MCVSLGGTDLPPPPPTHTLSLESKEKETQHSRMQGKQSNLGNFGSQECKQKQKSTRTTQIIQQKTGLKSNGLAGGFRDAAI